MSLRMYHQQDGKPIVTVQTCHPAFIRPCRATHEGNNEHPKLMTSQFLTPCMKCSCWSWGMLCKHVLVLFCTLMREALLPSGANLPASCPPQEVWSVAKPRVVDAAFSRKVCCLFSLLANVKPNSSSGVSPPFDVKSTPGLALHSGVW